jgi:hypothetical protein
MVLCTTPDGSVCGVHLKLYTAFDNRSPEVAARELEPLTAESTRPVAETRTHAGIVKVKGYVFSFCRDV